jgi:23S rRNA (cytosine1962-C5)-methyltransferase
MTRTFPLLILKPERGRSALRRHPWIFSGAVGKIRGEPKEGEIVEVLSSDGSFLALGHFGEGSISARLFSFERVDPDERFWRERFTRAYLVRKHLGLAGNGSTNAYRLINAEGDGLPGLVVDIYGETAVIQCHSEGMVRNAKMFSEIVTEIYGGEVVSVLGKRAVSVAEGGKGEEALPGFFPEQDVPFSRIIRENDLRFEVDLRKGQKTGFFLDQRENRRLLKEVSGGRRVLDAFSYSGGFSVYALAGGAKEVVSVDASREAVKLLQKNVSLNFPAPPHHAETADCFDFLKNMDREYDLIILDPPAFAKHRQSLKRAVKGYTTINAFALRQIKAGGLLFTFSCSQFFGRELFQKVLFTAAADAGREVRILYRLGQGPDHPVSLYHPEGEYLKGFVLHVF